MGCRGEQHDQGDAGQQAIEQDFDEAGGQGLLDRVDRAEARDDVAEMACAEVGLRQAHQVLEHVAGPAEVEVRAEPHHGPTAQGRHQRLEHDQQGEAQAEEGQQVVVAIGDDLIHHELHEQRCEQGEYLQHQRQAEDLRQPTAEAANRAGERAQRDRGCLALALEAGSFGEFDGDAGEMSTDLDQAQAAHAHCRIVHDRLVLADAAQHDEVVQVPVQHAGRRQLAELFHVQAQWPALQSEYVCDLDQASRGHALQRQAEAPP